MCFENFDYVASALTAQIWLGASNDMCREVVLKSFPWLNSCFAGTLNRMKKNSNVKCATSTVVKCAARLRNRYNFYSSLNC